ncbi:hypothetical protein TNCV_2037151 [Trichonephila clavipes]|nr:hypothetical protein TNCV_2037151 [Trichonephila clavipes]
MRLNLMIGLILYGKKGRCHGELAHNQKFRPCGLEVARPPRNPKVTGAMLARVDIFSGCEYRRHECHMIMWHVKYPFSIDLVLVLSVKLNHDYSQARPSQQPKSLIAGRFFTVKSILTSFDDLTTHFGNWNLDRFLHPISGFEGALRCRSWFGWMKSCGQYVKDQWRKREDKKERTRLVCELWTLERNCLIGIGRKSLVREIKSFTLIELKIEK